MKSVLIFGLLFSACAFADQPKLVIGYPDEGKVDASLSSCREFVKGVMGSQTDDPSYDGDVLSVCGARNAHVDAYAALQWEYQYFLKTIGQDNRINVDQAVKALKATIRNCVEYKTNLSTGGHNIAIDIIPNEIAEGCLQMGKNLLSEQSARYRQMPD